MSRRAATIVVAAAAVSALLLWGGEDRNAARRDRLAAEHRAEVGNEARGLRWRLPAGWVPVTSPLTAVVDPSQGLVAATFPLRQRQPDRGCAPVTARRRMPAGGALVIVTESLWAADVDRRLRHFPPRPRRFRLPPRATGLECFGAARAVAFREARRGFSVYVLLGSRARGARLRQVERLLDSLEVEPVPPPKRPRWDRWREVITEAGDSLRTPPGWTVGVVAVPRTLHRPRLLFFAASEPVGGWAPGRRRRLGPPRPPTTRGVVLWVVEHHPGPVSALFPPLTKRSFADRDTFSPIPSRPGTRAWRARAEWRGYRFSATVTAALDAPTAEIDRAFASAASLAVSGGLRDCSPAAERRRPDLCPSRPSALAYRATSHERIG